MSEGLSLKEIEQLEQKVKNSIPSLNGSAKETAPFDFRLPVRISDTHLKILKNTFNYTAENLSAFFSARLQTQVNIKLSSTDQIYYSEYIPSVACPSCIYIFRIADSEAKGLIVLNTELAFSLIDKMLGGTGNPAKHTNEITLIEQRLLKLLPDKINYEFENAWSVYGNYKLQIESFESVIDNIQLTAPHESVLLATFEMTMNDQNHFFNICYDTSSLDKLLKTIPTEKTQAVSIDDEDEIIRTKQTISSHLMNTYLPLTVEFGSSQITFNELMNLNRGDIIILSKKITDEHEIKVDNKVLFYGRPGIANNNKAIKITRKENF